MRPIDADELKKDLGEVLMTLMKSHEMSRIEKVGFALDVVDEAETLDVAPVSHGCEYCSGKRVEYQHTVNTKLYISTLGKAMVLEVECNSCPPYADCCMKGIHNRSAFVINYCPNCGKKMDGKEE